MRKLWNAPVFSRIRGPILGAVAAFVFLATAGVLALTYDGASAAAPGPDAPAVIMPADAPATQNVDVDDEGDDRDGDDGDEGDDRDDDDRDD